MGESPKVKPLVLQFQEDLTVGKKGIVELLRTAKLISAKLGLDSIQDWITHELNGYPDVAALPKYRFISGGQLQFLNPMHGWLPAMASPILDVPIFEPISKLTTHKPGDRVFFGPAEKFPLRDASGESEPIMSFPQRVEFATSEVIGILEAVKDRLLDWSIELERQGILGDNMSFKEEEKETAKNQTYNIEHMIGIIGNVSHSKVEIYDYSSVHKTLKEAGVPKAERDDLEQIMDDLKTASPTEKPHLIEKAKSWVAKNQEFLGAAVSIVMKALPDAFRP
jgi:hypothetical protein